MRPDERQVSPTIDGIRRDHVARYEFAAARLPARSSIIDFACGVGYGTSILAAAGHMVDGMDIDAEAIEYAKKHYYHPTTSFEVNDGNNPGELAQYEAAVCFETIEHIEDPRPLLRALRAAAPRLFASVPNENELPYGSGFAYHFRHYTPGQFQALLAECGWEVRGWYGQKGPDSEVEMGATGRTVIADCVRGEEVKIDVTPDAIEKPAAPKHVAILGLGPSLDQYTNQCKRKGGRHKYADQTWTINALGDLFACDAIFHMDDVRIQELRAEADPDSNISTMLDWMRTTDTPIITSRPHPDYPSTQAFPLIEVLNDFQYGYFNSTAAYAVAYAIWLGVERISLFGCDFTYPNAHDAEKGRACVEFWLGMAVERGIHVVVPKDSTLLDALHTERERFYGYDTLDLRITQTPAGRVNVEFSERAASELPTAAEVEAAYDHTAHPNALMVEDKSQ